MNLRWTAVGGLAVLLMLPAWDSPAPRHQIPVSERCVAVFGPLRPYDVLIGASAATTANADGSADPQPSLNPVRSVREDVLRTDGQESAHARELYLAYQEYIGTAEDVALGTVWDVPSGSAPPDTTVGAGTVGVHWSAAETLRTEYRWVCDLQIDETGVVTSLHGIVTGWSGCAATDPAAVTPDADPPEYWPGSPVGTVPHYFDPRVGREATQGCAGA